MSKVAEGEGFAQTGGRCPNPRPDGSGSGFQDRRIRPLCHPSAGTILAVLVLMVMVCASCS